MGRFESPNLDFYVVNFDTMKLIFCVKTAEILILQGFSEIEKERKLQYRWYHNFRSYVVEAMGVEPMSEKRSVSVSPGAGNLQHSLGVTPVARLTLW